MRLGVNDTQPQITFAIRTKKGNIMGKGLSKTTRFCLAIPYLISLYGLALLYLWITDQPLPLNTEPADIWLILGVGVLSGFIFHFLFRKRWLDEKNLF
jgi:hypothetical protein